MTKELSVPKALTAQPRGRVTQVYEVSYAAKHGSSRVHKILKANSLSRAFPFDYRRVYPDWDVVTNEVREARLTAAWECLTLEEAAVLQAYLQDKEIVRPTIELVLMPGIYEMPNPAYGVSEYRIYPGLDLEPPLYELCLSHDDVLKMNAERVIGEYRARSAKGVINDDRPGPELAKMLRIADGTESLKENRQ